MASFCGKYLLVISDLREETDDEAAAIYLSDIAKINPELFVEFLAMGGAYTEEERLSRFSELGISMTPNFKFGPLSKGPIYVDRFSELFVLQIAPLTGIPAAMLIEKLSTKKFSYLLLGALGTTNSSARKYDSCDHCRLDAKMQLI